MATPAAFFVVLATGLLVGGCFGTQVPPDRDAEHPLAGGKPGATPAEDATKREDKPGERISAKFDKTQTMISVNRGSRQASAECGKIHVEGPFGEVPVTLIVNGKGKIADAQLPAPFAGTPIGKCVEKAFEHEFIPPWDGPDERLETTVSLKKPAAPPPPEKPEKKK